MIINRSAPQGEDRIQRKKRFKNNGQNPCHASGEKRTNGPDWPINVAREVKTRNKAVVRTVQKKMKGGTAVEGVSKLKDNGGGRKVFPKWGLARNG